MIFNTPTIFASVALVALIMAVCLILVGQEHKRDGMRAGGAGLFAHALAYCCFTLYGQAPLWLTYGVGNTLLALALACYAASLLRIHGQPVPWSRIFVLPVLMAVALAALIDTREPRMFAACLVLILQCLLIMAWTWRYARHAGRAHLLLLLGGGISLIGLLLRVAAIASGAAAELPYDVSNLRQTVSVSIGTVTVMMFSLGLVLMAKEKTETALREMALRDALTGIANRRAIIEACEREIERARRVGTQLSIALLDIDHFKRINDSHGHLAGDAVLRQAAGLLRQRLRQSDEVGRYGGEEFLVLLPDTGRDGALTVIDSLRGAVAAQPAAFGDLRLPYRFSVGLWCGVPGPGDTSDSLIAHADAALYEVKAAGRDGVSVAPDRRGLLVPASG
ncbi:GGDEF domain-containing protein [uncultured Azonexus sp.]|uniref:GGDEF domain-containing protein n=1 Tax=uncultured Azonexus sp. TaxID=520307 RepID=UPI00260F02DE|nr:GGDEF domain-containing protein [uncultured Azonexus sp.]